MARRTILVVDDDRNLVAGLQDYLELKGFVIFTAFDGLQAYPMACARKPDLIILDVDMPVTNGLQALDKLRADPATKQIPVILMTGMVSGQVYPVIQNMPHVSHVKKPVDPDDLLSIVRHYIPESV